MYVLTLDRQYPLAEFKFDDIGEAFHYGEKLMRNEVKDPERDPLRVIINETQEKCAEGGNPEPAHNENQE